MSLSIPLRFEVAAEQKVARIEVSISLAFLHWVGIALHPLPDMADVAIFVLKGDVKLPINFISLLNFFFDNRPVLFCFVRDDQNLALVFLVFILSCWLVVYFCYGFVFAFIVLGLVFQYLAKRLALKNVSEMTHKFVLGGT